MLKLFGYFLLRGASPVAVGLARACANGWPSGKPEDGNAVLARTHRKVELAFPLLFAIVRIPLEGCAAENEPAPSYHLFDEPLLRAEQPALHPFFEGQAELVQRAGSCSAMGRLAAAQWSRRCGKLWVQKCFSGKI